MRVRSLVTHHYQPMSRKEELYILLGLSIAALSCGAGWLALPQLQPWLDAQLKNALFLPLIGITLVALIAVGTLAILLRDWIAAQLRALVPRNRLEARYLEAVQQTFGKTPALLAGSDGAAYSDLALVEAFSPLTLRPDYNDGLGGAEASLVERSEDFAGSPAAPSSRVSDGRGADRRRIGAQIVYWGLWAVAQALALALAVAVVGWLIWSPVVGWQFLALALLGGGLWFLAARWLHAWLVAEEDVLADLLAWWRRRGMCITELGTPGAEIWAHPRLLIRGHPGSGKTTLMRHIAVICARERLGLIRRSPQQRVRALYGWPACPFPLYIPLRVLDLSSRDQDLLHAYGQKQHLLLNHDLAACDARFFTERLSRGGCLVLLDAFDELRDVETRHLVGRLIAALPPGPRRRPNRFVVTSRIVGYEGQLNSEGYVRRRVEDLDDAQAARFIQARYAAIAASEQRAHAQALNWKPERQAENLIRRLPNNPGLRRLSRNPLLLSLTVALHYDHRGRGLQLPEERYRLYEEALRLMVRDWERRKDADVNLEPTDDRSDLTLDERLRLLRELAWMLFEQSADRADARAHAVVRGSHARAKLAEVLALLPGFAPEKTGAARSVHASSEAERWMQNISQRGGVLQELGNVPGSNDVEVQFAHLTFQEYLAARAAASEDGERRLGRILACWEQTAWREVLLLYAASHDATPVIQHLLAQNSVTSTLLAGAVLLERPISLSLELQARTLERLRAVVFVRADVSEAEADAALQQLEERTALPERPALLHAFTAAPHGPVRARALELVLDHQLVFLGRGMTRAAPHPLGQRLASPPPPLALPPELVPMLLRAFAHDPHAITRLAAGNALAGRAPRFVGADWLPELVHVPAGPFLMGSATTDTMAGSDEQPPHRLELPAYWIGKYPVTVAQWRAFVADGGYTTRTYWTAAGWQFINPPESEPSRSWLGRLLPDRNPRRATEPNVWRDPATGDDNLPVVNVSWFEAVAYCRWLSEKTGHTYCLPSEAEWEKAARGPDGLIWPWGNTWEAMRCNSEEAGRNRTTPVGSFPAGVSPYGALDMAGNVWEWCATQYGKGYPYALEDEWTEAYLETADAGRRRRGGSFWNAQNVVRGAYRSGNDARDRDSSIGLRVASHSLLPGSDS